MLDALDAKYNGDFQTAFRAEMGGFADQVVAPAFNGPERIWQFIENIGNQLLRFSLSERMDVTPMWAHYADNNGGFVVACDTGHEWFQCRKDGNMTRLQKVTYFDGKVEEQLANVQAALISKTTDWEYERERRLYVKEDKFDNIVCDPADPIQSLNFPPDAVDLVISGPNSRDETMRRVRDALGARYPNTRILRAVPNRANHTYDEVDP